MEDYEPLDLSAFCNAGVELIAERQAPQTGALTFHGLPFQTGMGERCFVAFGEGIDEGPLTIPIDRPARRVIVAHRLLRSAIKEGGPIGDPVAEYLFRLEGDETERVPIRERFEISVVPPKSFGGEGKPFLAVDDQKDSLMPRYEGPWEQAGRRQMESIPGAALEYVLWVWENPKPDRTIEAMEVIPAGPGFLIGGITLGHRDEHPISREATREVIITLPQEEDAEKPFDLEVDVDRGIATYPYALPEQSAEDFLQDSTKGWGEPQNEKSSPAYVEIAAIPSATVKVKQGGEVLGEVPWSELESKGQLDPTERLNVRVVDNGRNWVHTRVVDDETGKPVPCRVHFRSPRAYRTPHTAITRTSIPTWARGITTWAEICGWDRSPMPISTGPVRVGCRGVR